MIDTILEEAMTGVFRGDLLDTFFGGHTIFSVPDVEDDVRFVPTTNNIAEGVSGGRFETFPVGDDEKVEDDLPDLVSDQPVMFDTDGVPYRATYERVAERLQNLEDVSTMMTESWTCDEMVEDLTCGHITLSRSHYDMLMGKMFRAYEEYLAAFYELDMLYQANKENIPGLPFTATLVPATTFALGLPSFGEYLADTVTACLKMADTAHSLREMAMDLGSYFQTYLRPVCN